MAMLNFILFLSISLVHSADSQSARPNDDRILHLEQTVSDLQAQNQAQEQKQAAVLSSILSKLSSNSEELQALKLEHNTTLGELTMITTELQTCRNNYISVANQLTNNTESLQNVSTGLTVLQLDQASTLDVLSQVKSQLDNTSTLSTSGTESWDTEISFQAALSFSTINMTKGEILKFDDIKLNAGNDYDSTSGIFVAPTSGSYLFWCHVMSDFNKPMSIILYRNSLSTSIAYAAAFRDMASLTHMVHLHKGDRVWFATQLSTRIRGSRFSSLGGTLVHVN